MTTASLRVALGVVFGVALSSTAACGSSDSGATVDDGGSDGGRDVVTTPVDTGQCPATPVVEGAACGPEAAGGVVCTTASKCTACGYQSYYQKTMDCTCRSGVWACENAIVDCGPMAPGRYSDATCTTKNPDRDAGTDASADGGDGGDGGDASDATDATDGG